MKWILAFLITSQAFAYYPTRETECSPLDLRNETLGDVRNQGKVSWCYAFAGADMLAHTFNLPEKISAADIALNYNESLVGRILDIFLDNGNPHETGFNKFSLQKAMKDGYCPESVFPSERWIKVTGDKEESVTLREAIDLIVSLHKNRKLYTEKTLPFYFKFKNVGPSEFYSVLQNKKPRQVFNDLRHAACSRDRMSFDTRWKVKMTLRHENIFWRLNEQLDVGRPVGLDYDARILENRDHRGVKLSELHTSAIVGRRWNPEARACEYLIRNSYGKECNRYDPRYECKDGHQWLGESQIYGSMTSIVYMLSTPR